MDYKKIIRSQNMRFKILKLLNFVPDSFMIKVQYMIKTGRKLNLKNPRRYTEKLQWYKLYYRNPIMTKCVDKYFVREYIKSKKLDYILNELYNVYDNVEEINFDELPNSFVLKTTNGSGTNILCNNKKELDIDLAKKELNFYLKRETKNAGREWAYNDVRPIIICEKYIKPKSESDLKDYKFMCFNGKVEYIVVDCDRHTNHKRNIYDTTWKNLNIKTDCDSIDHEIKKPSNLKKMISIAEKLSSDFPHVRVDLYDVDGKIIFGELTFYPWSGYVNYYPDTFDFELGDKFVLEEYKGE